MTERKPVAESWESFAERKMQEAIQSGSFDHLSGAGEPIADIDKPLEENWWVKKKLRDEQLSVLPPILAVKLEAERTLAELPRLRSERAVRYRLRKLNEKIHDAQFSPIRGPADGIFPIDLEAAVQDWKRSRESATT